MPQAPFGFVDRMGIIEGVFFIRVFGPALRPSLGSLLNRLFASCRHEKDPQLNHAIKLVRLRQRTVRVFARHAYAVTGAFICAALNQQGICLMMPARAEAAAAIFRPDRARGGRRIFARTNAAARGLNGCGPASSFIGSYLRREFKTISIRMSAAAGDAEIGFLTGQGRRGNGASATSVRNLRPRIHCADPSGAARRGESNEGRFCSRQCAARAQRTIDGQMDLL